MENNNRQGCRWVLDFDFWKSSNYEPVEEGNYQGLYKYKYDVKGSGTFYTAKELLDKYLKATESESIEPCATSSRIEELENGIKNFIEWLKEKRPTITGTGAPKMILESLLEGRETFATPSPTGDRDCEVEKEIKMTISYPVTNVIDEIDEVYYLRDEVKRLKESISELEEENNKLIMLTKQLLNKHP